MNVQGQGATRAVKFRSDGNVTKSIAGMVKARDVHLTGSGAGVVAADGDVSILKGGCGLEWRTAASRCATAAAAR